MRRFFYAVSHDLDTQAHNLTHPQLHTFAVGDRITLTDNVFHHWCRVLRASNGDVGVLFDGLGGEYRVQIQTIGKKQATVTLLGHNAENHTTMMTSKIGLVMSRGERMDYAIQKATELGATCIQLLSSHHGEVTLKPAQVEKKLAHWQQVAIAACEQCGLNRPPLIFAPLSLSNWLQHLTMTSLNPVASKMAVSPIVDVLSQDPYYQTLNRQADIRLIMSVPDTKEPAIPKLLPVILKQERPHIELLIGPEGGLSDDERQRAQAVGFLPWQIGTRVLRTETAPVVALATLHALSDCLNAHTSYDHQP